MLDSFPVSLAVGTVLGFLSGLGVGGGSLLILWLTLVLGMDQTIARMMNLLFFLPAAGISCYFRWKNGTLEWKRIFPAIIAGCLGAAMGAWFAGHLDTRILKKGFGLLLMGTGIRELLWKGKDVES